MIWRAGLNSVFMVSIGSELCGDNGAAPRWLEANGGFVPVGEGFVYVLLLMRRRSGFPCFC